MSWRVTHRIGPKVRRSEHATLDEAIETVRAAAQAAPRREPVDLRYRSFKPIEQVAARAEIQAPDGRRGGIDVRGDGSAEAYTGRFRRKLVEQREKEDVYAALRRALSGET